MINEIFIYEATVPSGPNEGEPLPSMKVKGNSPITDMEAMILQVYQLLEPRGARVGGETGNIWEDFEGHALVPTNNCTAIIDFMITRCKDGGVNLEGCGGIKKSIDYVVKIAGILKGVYPNLTINDQPGYMRR